MRGINCVTCGKFMVVEPGVAWRTIYSGWPPTPDREEYQCKPCTEKVGTFIPQYGIRPECSCGVVK